MPILQVRLALNRMNAGETLDILADDPTFQKDFASFCQLASVICLDITRITPTTTYYRIQVSD